MKNIEFYKNILCECTFDKAWAFAREHGLSSKQVETYGADAAFGMWLFEEHSAMTESERDYILSVIAPFRGLIWYIEKVENKSIDVLPHIEIIFNDQSTMNIPLMGKMEGAFKGMSTNTLYELEDIADEKMDD